MMGVSKSIGVGSSRDNGEICRGFRFYVTLNSASLLMFLNIPNDEPYSKLQKLDELDVFGLGDSLWYCRTRFEVNIGEYSFIDSRVRPNPLHSY